MSKKCNIVAEIGTVHLGQLERAKELSRLAKLCDADYVKFQKRNPDESTPEQMKDKPHPNEQFSYGDTYLDHRKNLELTIEQHAELKDFCENYLKIGYSSSVWDMTSAKEMVGLNPDFIKIGSPSNQNIEMLEYLFNSYNGQIHISLGMLTITERDNIIQWVCQSGVDFRRLVFYHCTSEYPVPFSRIYLSEVSNLRQMIPAESEVGFSNHGYGVALDPVAYVLGATWIERHFVDDRTLKHTDAAFSLEPNGLRTVCRNIHAVCESLRLRPHQLSNDEMFQRQKLKGY